MAKENENTLGALTYEQVMEIQSIGDEVDAINVTKICGVVVKVDALPTTQRTNKDGSLQTDDNGNPTFFDAMYWCQIGITGGDDGVVLSAEQLNDVEVGKKYVFIGSRKNRKFKATQIVSKADYVSALVKARFGV